MSNDNLIKLVQSYFAHLDEMRRLTETHEERMRKMRSDTALLLTQIRAAVGLNTTNADDPLQQFRPDPR